MLNKTIHSQHLFWLTIIILCVLLQWLTQTSSFRYDRNLIIAGEWYRLFSASFVHLNNVHLFMNIIGIIFVSIFFSSSLKLLQWFLLIVLSSLFITICLLWLNEDIQFYIGFSGVLHSLFIAGAIAEIRRYPVSGWLFTISLMLKLAWEQLYGAIPGSETLTNGQVIVDSHLYGAFSGMIFMLLIQKIQRNT